MNKVLIINGPNLNFLGKRDHTIYGKESLADLESLCKKEAENLGLLAKCAQTNSEGEIINLIQQANIEQYKGIVLNPAGYSHTSIAIMDAVLDSIIPIIEVHISNVHKREEFRSVLYTAKAARGVITGLGFTGYLAALYTIAKS